MSRTIAKTVTITTAVLGLVQLGMSPGVFAASTTTHAPAALNAAPMTQSIDSDSDADVAQSESRLDSRLLRGERRYLLDPVELTPSLGFTVVDGNAGFNVGTHAAYPLLSNAPLFAEPSLIVGIFSGNTMVNLTAAARYDIELAGTKIRPFARAGFGPTFETSGSVAVFNATFGGGVLYPIKSSLDLRAELGLVDIDGNAGVQLLTGLSL